MVWGGLKANRPDESQPEGQKQPVLCHVGMPTPPSTSLMEPSRATAEVLAVGGQKTGSLGLQLGIPTRMNVGFTVQRGLRGAGVDWGGGEEEEVELCVFRELFV